MARPKKSALPDYRPAPARTNVQFPAAQLAYLNWRATIEGITRDALLAAIVAAAHTADPNPKKPPID